MSRLKHWFSRLLARNVLIYTSFIEEDYMKAKSVLISRGIRHYTRFIRANNSRRDGAYPVPSSTTQYEIYVRPEDEQTALQALTAIKA
ncbi:hypothetical protein ACE3NQ_01905 [Paenibacillus terreus]|uniref:DUF2007 domain-containing protein n=1 Tax=Paenibacillus terreus TaxID=1387834 RepID=A0ABV5B1X2_9BACL